MSLPIRICTSTEMKALDEIAEKSYSISPQILMENAGRAAVNVLFDHFPDAGRNSEILVFAGKGNNAGDAFVVARRLLCLERKVRIFYWVNENTYQGATLHNFQILKKMRAKLVKLDSAADLAHYFTTSNGPFLVIDGILGTGLRGNLEGIFHDVVELINKHATDVVSLDIPSGVSGDTGQINGVSLQASLTVSFGFPKFGHFLPPGASKRGKLVNVDISLPPEFRHEGGSFLLTKRPLQTLIKMRDKYGHKNSFGHTLIVGGSMGRLGAAVLASRSCHKMGTGLVTVATWNDSSYTALLQKLSDETMAVPIDVSLEGLVKTDPQYLSQFSSVVIGPGLGMNEKAKKILEQLIFEYKGPIIFDADALNVIGKFKLHDQLKARQAPNVLTPHPGEMARLLDIDKDKVMEDPLSAIKKAVDQTYSIVLLKGAATLLYSPESKLYLNHYPNDGMATAGTGDVLSGMIGGLLGQEMEAFSATQLAVFIHSLAGGYAAEQKGHRSMTARDIIENIGNAFKNLKTKEEPVFPEEGRVHLL